MGYKVSDLIVSINFDESKKKNKLVVETYEGSIPNFKSKKYSGQLRSVNINSSTTYDNVSSVDLQLIREFLNKETNIQINKNQYMLSSENLMGVDYLIRLGCLFYKDKINGMYQVEAVDYSGKMAKNSYAIDGLKYSGEKTTIFLDIAEKDISAVVHEIEAKVYINLSDKSFPLELKFDYGILVVDFLSKNRNLDTTESYRDYGFEKRTQIAIKECGWELRKVEGFKYVGKDLGRDIAKLTEKGIYVYTNNEKKIVPADFSDIRVSYDLDWFSIKGKVTFDLEDIDIAELINFRKKKENWIEYNGKIIFIPTALSSKTIERNKENGELRIKKKQISSAISIAHDINGTMVHDLDSLIDYKNVSCSIDANIAKQLRDYQLVGVKWLLSLRNNGFGACLADDMGLGKTLQIIAYLSDKSMNGSNNLIIVPKTLLINWKREIEKFLPSAFLSIYHGAYRNISVVDNCKIVISTYQTVVNDLDLFLEKHFDNLIIDEAQYIKNSKSKAHNALKRIDATMKIILTGTPIENNLAEFWGLMRLINPDIVESYAIVSKNQDQLVNRIKMLSAPFLLRRLKKDVLKDLPEKQEQTLWVKMDTEQQAIYDRMLESIRYEILRKNDRFEIKSNSIILNGLLYLQEICCHPQLLSKEYNNGCVKSAKLELLIDLLKSLYSTGHKVVVFSRFTKMLSIIEKKVSAEHMNFYYLDGGTKDRMSVVDEFEKSENGIFLISLKAGGTGINLISADTAIIYDPWWNPASEKQAEDRIYRIGQKKNVMIYRLIADGTIEEKVQKLQDEKIKLCSDILDGHEIPMSLTTEIMEQLLLS